VASAIPPAAYKAHCFECVIKKFAAPLFLLSLETYYSSVQDFTSGATVRQWLATQPYEAQREFGLQILKDYGY
jgi:hypothetical protein